MNNLRKLRWNPIGYEIYNWIKYRSVLSPFMIAHDLYCHEKTDRGKIIDEVKAMGCHHYYNSYDHKMIQQNLDFIFNEYFKYDNIHNYKKVKLFNLEIYDNDSKYFSKIFNQGIDYARRFSEDLYNKVQKIDFLSYHKVYETLIIDLNKAEIIDSYISVKTKKYLEKEKEITEKYGNEWEKIMAMMDIFKEIKDEK